MFKAWKKATPVAVLVALALTTFGSTAGATDIEDPLYKPPIDGVKQTKTQIEFTPYEAQQLEVQNGGVYNSNIAGGTVVVDGVLTETQKQSYKDRLLNPVAEEVPVATPTDENSIEWCSGLYLSGVTYVNNNTYFTSRRLMASEGRGPITLSVTVNKSVSATYSANVSVSASVVTAGVGYSFSTTYGVSASGTWAVPSGYYGRLEAYAMHNKHTWKVYDDDCGTPEDTYKGSGASYKPNGSVYFKRVYL